MKQVYLISFMALIFSKASHATCRGSYFHIDWESAVTPGIFSRGELNRLDECNIFRQRTISQVQNQVSTMDVRYLGNCYVDAETRERSQVIKVCEATISNRSFCRHNNQKVPFVEIAINWQMMEISCQDY